MSNQSKAAWGARDDVWLKLLADWRASGLSVQRFCLERGLAESTFYSWRKRLSCVSSGRAGLDASAADETGTFVEVALPRLGSSEAAGKLKIPTVDSACKGSLPSAAKGVESPRLRSELSASCSSSAGLELVLGGGAVLRIPAGTDRATLGDVLAVLHEEGLC